MIRIGMVAFRPDPTTFYTVLEQASIVADEVVVIYGRFKDFNMEYKKCPLMPVRDNITLIETDHKNTQFKQRDIYLEGLVDNDILLMWDSDMILMNDPGDVRKFLLSLDRRWDSMQVEWLKADGVYEQTSICVFRYRKGWRHQSSNLLADKEENLICSPHHTVIRSGAEMVYFHLRDQGQAYRIRQREYWDHINKR